MRRIIATVCALLCAILAGGVLAVPTATAAPRGCPEIYVLAVPGTWSNGASPGVLGEITVVLAGGTPTVELSALVAEVEELVDPRGRHHLHGTARERPGEPRTERPVRRLPRDLLARVPVEAGEGVEQPGARLERRLVEHEARVVQVGLLALAGVDAEA